MILSIDRLRILVVFLTSLSMWHVWLPMMRTLSGQESYVWANSYFGNPYRGFGWHGDILLLVYQALLGIAILWLGLRNPRAPFAFLAVVWHLILFGGALYPVLAGEQNIFIGDTGGVRWDLTIIEPLAHGAALAVVAAYVCLSFLSSPSIADVPWTRRNTRLALLFLAYLIGVTILEWTGPAHGASDMVAVPLNVLAPTLLALAFYPWKEQPAPSQSG